MQISKRAYLYNLKNSTKTLNIKNIIILLIKGSNHIYSSEPEENIKTHSTISTRRKKMIDILIKSKKCMVLKPFILKRSEMALTNKYLARKSAKKIIES
jgi:hypothetical protein